MSQGRQKPALYIQNPKIKMDLMKADIIITEKSKELRKKGLPGQRYVINTYIDDKNGVLIQSSWPTVNEEPPSTETPETPAEEKKREAQEEMIKKAQIDLSDVVRCPIRGRVGVVHVTAQKKDRRVNERCMSGSADKLNNNNTMRFVGRSTNNYFPFLVNTEFLYLYYHYKQENFNPNISPYGITMLRSLQWEIIEKWFEAQEKIQPELNEEGNTHSAAERAMALAMSKKNCVPLNSPAVVEWQSLYDDDIPAETRCKRFHDLWMHTIYITSGIKKGSYSLAHSDENIVTKCLNNASRHGVKLNLEHIPKEIKNANGATALINAAIEGKLKVAEILLNAGANPNAKDAKGLTALDYAIINKNKDLCELLINNKGFQSNLTKESKHELTLFGQSKPYESTVLHTAVRENGLYIVKLLLEKKADPTAKDTNGLTPVDLAVQNDRIEILNCFLPHLSKEHIDEISKQDNLTDACKQAIQEHIDTVKLKQ